MKAKEIAKLYSKGSRTGKISKEFLKHDIIEYAKRKCWEQKKECNKYVRELSEQHKELYGDIVLNSPYPKFE